MLTGRNDIVGDLARLHRDFLGAAKEADDVLNRLELLATAAIQHGMSDNIVAKASGIPRERIDAILAERPMAVTHCAAKYERHPNGVVAPHNQ